MIYQIDQNAQRFHSILRTIRKIEKLEINFTDLKAEHIQTAITIIKKFSSSIKYLKLENGGLDMKNYLYGLSLVSNATHLHLRCLKVPLTSKKAKRKRRTTKKNPNLEHLNILEVYDCDDAYLDLFNRLPRGVLTELRLDVGDLRRYNNLFKRQPN